MEVLSNPNEIRKLIRKVRFGETRIDGTNSEKPGYNPAEELY